MNEGEQFRQAFNQVAREPERAAALQAASLSAQLGAWTKELTAVVVRCCEAAGWRASAKAHPLDLLPEPRSEYLGMDVVAFAGEGKKWRFPVAVIELENQNNVDRIGYSLWKVLCVRANLRVVLCYSGETNQVPTLVSKLSRDVIDGMGIGARTQLEGETLLVVGSRGDAETFPFGFFHWWELNRSTGKFERI